MAYANEKKKYSKEHLWYVEIEVDGTTHRFCENRSPLPAGLSAIPSLQSVRVNPAEINLEGGIGVRAKCSISLMESDDYTEWGTVSAPVRFWSRWRAENPYYLGERISVFSGYIVNDTFDASNFTKRDYIIESFGQRGSGVSITGKDPLKLASNDRAKAPRESRGSLNADITDVTTTFTLQPAGIGNSEYPATNGIVRIGDEVMLYTTRTNDIISGLTRGYYNTDISEHSENDTVQLCLEYDAMTPSEIDYDLLVNYANVDTSYINQAEWDANSANAFIPTYSALITEPTGVQELLKEFAQSAPHYLYWDERVNQIRFNALRPPPTDAVTLNYQSNFIEGSTAVKDMQDMRVSTVICNYGIINPTKDLDESSNYRASYVREDSDSVTNYGQRAYKKINSRWITSDNKTAAVLMSARVGRRFSEAPRMLSFEVDAKDSDIWTGDSVKCQTDLIEQAGGGFPSLFYQILTAGESQNFNYTALEHTYGEAVPGDEDVEDPNVRLVYISGEQDQLKGGGATARTLRDIFDEVYGSPVIDNAWDIRFIFESNAVAGSSDNAAYAIDTGAWPATLTDPILIQNNGLIVGNGGDGADVDGTAQDGGPAIILNADIRLDNLNIIGGGGGGGGYSIGFGTYEARAAGGGGAGFSNGIAGTGTSASGAPPPFTVTEAQDGTNTAGGEGAFVRINAFPEPSIARGGDGGDLGQNGQGGTNLGLAGKAIELNGFTVTYIETGTILGVVS
jgi:hypothetical protein